MASTLTRNQQNLPLKPFPKHAGSPVLEPSARSQPAAEPARRPAADPKYLAHDTRNWLTVLQVYCDLLKTCDEPPEDAGSGRQIPRSRRHAPKSQQENEQQRRQWIEELSTAVERGQGLVVSLLDSVDRAERTESGREPQTPKTNQTAAAAKAPGAGLIEGSGTNASLLGRTLPDRRWRPSAPDMPSAPPLDLDEAVRRRVPLLQRLAGAHIHLEAEAAADAGKAALAEIDFERILHNLVLNAIEAMPKGGRLRIVLRRGNRSATGSATERGKECGKRSAGPGKQPGDRRSADSRAPGSKTPVAETVLLRVYDTGDGIPLERLPHLFEAGISSKSEAKDGSHSHGFGLASVRQLAEGAGGAVRVRSHPGKGSCFEIELPRI